MKNAKMTIFAALTSLTFVAVLLTLVVSADIPDLAITSGDWIYMNNDDTATVIRYNGTQTEVTVPSLIDGLKVTAIEGGEVTQAFGDEVTKVTIPNSVTQINEYAFKGCDCLQSVVIPDSVTMIGRYAFSNCPSLKEISIPKSVASIGSFAFMGCSSLEGIYIEDISAWCAITFPEQTSNPLFFVGDLYLNGELVTDLVLPDSLTQIGQNAFAGCTCVKSVTLPKNMTEIAASAFSGCTSLESISFPEGMKTIGYKSFSGCTALQTVTLPDSVETVGYHAFGDCTSLTDVKLSSGLKSIEDGGFFNCFSLKEIDLPEGLTTIGGAAFRFCREFTSVTIPASVTEIRAGAFKDCASLNEITVKEGNDSFICIDGILYTKDLKTLIFCMESASSVDSLPDGVTKIVYAAFSGCKDLSQIKLPTNVVSIESFAFDGCQSMEDVIVPKSLETVEYCAFINCPSLKHVYYAGNDSEWDKINIIEWGNEDLISATVYFESDGPAVTSGDINGDGKTNAKDVTMLMKYIVGFKFDNFDETVADVNGDGKINAKDVIELMRSLVRERSARATIAPLGYSELPRAPMTGDPIITVVSIGALSICLISFCVCVSLRKKRRIREA